jgi:hypothetical protein
MATLQSRLSDLITAIGTDIKQLRTWITGSSSGTLTGLTTTDKTSIVNAINEVKAGSGTPAAASETVSGIAELATQAETNAGTDDARIVTPLKLQTRMAAYAQPLDAELTALAAMTISTDGTLAGNSDTNLPTQKAVKTYADALIAANDAMVYKGVIDASASPNYPASNRGDTYRISVAGKIGGASGPNVEVGDMLVALTDGTVAGTQAAVGAQWNIVQSNLDGAVTGPTSSTSGNLPSFSGTTGKVVADSGFSPSNAAIGAGSATVLPTSAQIVAYAQPLDADLTAIAALTTTTYGRALLALANQAALLALLPTPTETTNGVIEIATQAEVTTGTDDVRAVTPLKHATDLTSKLGNPDTDLAAAYATAKA